MPAYSLNSAYDYCLQLARSHYENFPVASRLLPGETRKAVAVIYAFARRADDLVDEGEDEAPIRLKHLAEFTQNLDDISQNREQTDPIFIALADVIQRHALPLQLFHDLLSAFRQDVTKKRYADFDEVLDYCRRSANPVGRLLLHLHNEATEQNVLLSDNICSALQLINFLQDIEQDYQENRRIYLPQNEMVEYGVSEEDIARSHSSEQVQQLILHQLQRAHHLMLHGALLGTRLNGLFGLEIRLIIEAGLTVCEKLAAHGGNVFSRPRLAKKDYLLIFWRALQKGRHINAPATPFSS